MNNGRHWTQEEVSYLMKHASESPEEIGKHLGRTRISVIGKLQRIGLASKYEHWTNKQVATLKKYYLIYRTSYLSKLIGKTGRQIRSKASSMGMKLSDGNE